MGQEASSESTPPAWNRGTPPAWGFGQCFGARDPVGLDGAGDSLAPRPRADSRKLIAPPARCPHCRGGEGPVLGRKKGRSWFSLGCCRRREGADDFFTPPSSPRWLSNGAAQKNTPPSSPRWLSNGAAPAQPRPQPTDAAGLCVWDMHETSPTLAGAWPRSSGGPAGMDRGSWAEPDARASFKLRGRTYLIDKVKVPSPDPAFRLISVRTLMYPRALRHCARVLPSLLGMLQREDSQEFFIAVRNVPNGRKEFFNHISVFQRVLPEGADAAFDRLWAQFRKRGPAGDAFRNARLKYVPSIVVAPWYVTKPLRLLGGTTPVIMGKGYLEQTFFHGQNYVEVNVDISSSAVARQISGKVIGNATSCVVEEAFVIEGRNESELPERPLGVLRNSYMTTKNRVDLSHANLDA